MFAEAFPKFQNAKIIRVLNAYFGSIWHVVVLALVMTLSALLSLELPAAYIYLASTVCVCLFCEDMRGFVPVVVCVPMSLSIPNNPAYRPNNIFSDNAAVLQIGVCLLVLFIFIVGRLISILLQRRKKGAPRLTVGYVAVLLAYVLGGLNSPYYSKVSVFFGILQWVALSFFYFYFYYTVDWKKAPKGYLAGVFTVVGFALVVQVLNMYFQDGVVVNGVIYRGNLYPGWGTYNLIGCMTAMCIPAVFYFAATQKHGWIFTLLASTVMLGVFLTQSRGSILFGGIVYFVSMLAAVIKSVRRERIFHLIVLALIVIAVILCVHFFREKLKAIFETMLEIGIDDDGRKPLFEQAWKYFKDYPVFGVGWGGDRWQGNGNSYMHYFMAHNTLLQTLGCFGAFGTAAYLFHRIQTLVIVFRKFSAEKFFMGLIVATLLLCCMLDCHIYSFFPALYYSIALVFIECDGERADREPLAKKGRRRKKKGELPPVKEIA